MSAVEKKILKDILEDINVNKKEGDILELMEIEVKEGTLKVIGETCCPVSSLHYSALERRAR